jgi:hypothetical protein
MRGIETPSGKVAGVAAIQVPLLPVLIPGGGPAVVVIAA